MNSFLCLSLLFAVASAAPKPQPVSWSYSVQDESVKPGSWYNGVAGAPYISSSAPTGYWPSYYSQSIPQPVEVTPKNYYLYKNYQNSAPVAVARSDSSEWKYQPASWSDASNTPKWSEGFYSAGVPISAKVDQQTVAKKVEAPVKVDQVQPVADQTPKFTSYST